MDSLNIKYTERLEALLVTEPLAEDLKNIARTCGCPVTAVRRMAYTYFVKMVKEKGGIPVGT